MTKTLTNIRKSSRMLTIAFAACIAISSCKKNDDTTSGTSAVTDDEVAEAITQSVSSSSGGMVYQNESSSAVVSTSLSFMWCGQSSDTVISKTNAPGAAISYNYNIAIGRTLTCTNDVPSQFYITFTGNNNYTAPHMSSADSVNAQCTITGIQPSSSSYVFNESYHRKGTQQSSVRLQRSITSSIIITTTNLTIDKATQKIVSGTASVQFAGSVTGGASASRGGTITFLGNSQATLILDNNSTYTIQW